jgi:D-arabinose 1-dehydrogenase-like Zn-dependent alcohol dehydrogenase
MTAVTPGTTAAGTMTAILQDDYGTAPEAVLRLAEITRPAIADDEILVQVAAASVDRGTWHLMAGLPYPIRLAGFGLRRPKAPNPGRSLAGTVESAGPKVTEFKPGDEVYGTCDGSFAPYARAQAGRLAPKPANLSFAQAAAVPVSALTALHAVRDQSRVQPGRKVQIVGASGGVGTFAVQIAKAFGAEVTGVCSTAKTDLVRARSARPRPPSSTSKKAAPAARSSSPSDGLACRACLRFPCTRHHRRVARRGLQLDVPARTEPHAGHQRPAAGLLAVPVPPRAPVSFPCSDSSEPPCSSSP